jgi:hypothetical protein
MIKYSIISSILVFLLSHRTYSQNIEPIVSSYLGSEKRNYYGNEAPDTLALVWKLWLGEGRSPAYGDPNRMWKGAGWTGQALFIRENDKNYLIQPSFDYGLKKIDIETQKIVWEYKFDDILKGSPAIWENQNAKNSNEKYVIMQGSRRGADNPLDADKAYSFRAISYFSGKELWRMNVEQTISYSRDVDATVLVINDTAYIPLENGIFTIFSPDPAKAHKVGKYKEPLIYKEILYFNLSDTLTHGTNLETESAPVFLNNFVYTTAGSGRVYGYNTHARDTTWVFNIGSDLNGTPTVTYDNNLLIPVEKDYIPGNGGVYKLNPSEKPENSVVWYYPTANRKWFHWRGGIIGSVAVNDATTDSLHLAAFVGVDGFLHIVQHDQISGMFGIGTDGKTLIPMPELLYKSYIGGTISTPIFIKNKLIVALDNGLLLYRINKNASVELIARLDNMEIDATPIAVDGFLYLASRDGYLYCFGRKQ